MATGRLGTANLTSISITDVYTVPAATKASIGISICNRGNDSRSINLALSSASGVQGNDEYIEYNVVLLASGVLERTGITLAAGQIVTAAAVGPGSPLVSVVVTGVEEGV